MVEFERWKCVHCGEWDRFAAAWLICLIESESRAHSGQGGWSRDGGTSAEVEDKVGIGGGLASHGYLEVNLERKKV